MVARGCGGSCAVLAQRSSLCVEDGDGSSSSSACCCCLTGTSARTTNQPRMATTATINTAPTTPPTMAPVLSPPSSLARDCSCSDVLVAAADCDDAAEAVRVVVGGTSDVVGMGGHTDDESGAGESRNGALQVKLPVRFDGRLQGGARTASGTIKLKRHCRFLQ